MNKTGTKTDSKNDKIEITGKLLGKEYKRAKNLFSNNEEKALQDVLDKNKYERRNNLEAQHTKRSFVWKGKTKLNQK